MMANLCFLSIALLFFQQRIFLQFIEVNIELNVFEVFSDTCIYITVKYIKMSLISTENTCESFGLGHRISKYTCKIRHISYLSILHVVFFFTEKKFQTPEGPAPPLHLAICLFSSSSGCLVRSNTDIRFLTYIYFRKFSMVDNRTRPISIRL
jgi:hypothetical protein